MNVSFRTCIFFSAHMECFCLAWRNASYVFLFRPSNEENRFSFENLEVRLLRWTEALVALVLYYRVGTCEPTIFSDQFYMGSCFAGNWIGNARVRPWQREWYRTTPYHAFCVHKWPIYGRPSTDNGAFWLEPAQSSSNILRCECKVTHLSSGFSNQEASLGLCPEETLSSVF